MLNQKNKEIPTEKVIDMQNRGMQSQEIISNLQKEGYKHDQISQAMDHAVVKGELGGMESPQESSLGRSPIDEIPMGLMNAPSPTQPEAIPDIPQQPEPEQIPGPSPQESYETSSPSGFAPEPLERGSYDAIEEIAESIIKEKWDEMVKKVGDIQLWKERTEIDIEGVKQELVRTQDKFEGLLKSVMGRISEYSEGVVNIGTEMKALERVLEKLLSPLTRSVKDLQEVSEKLSAVKTRKKPSTRKKSK
jgi:hypothetical protein